MNKNIQTAVATVVILAVVLVQIYFVYNMFVLDALNELRQIPLLLGINVILYAIILVIFLKVFIGMQAYKPKKNRQKPSTKENG